MLDKDDFVGWFMENYKEDEDAIVSVKELYKDFKNSEFFMKSSARDRRSVNNEKHFKEMLQGKLKHLFVPVFTYINGVRITKDSIKGYSKKPIDIDSDED